MLFVTCSLTFSANPRSDAYCNRIRPYTTVHDNIRPYTAIVYGVENFTFQSLCIFIRSPYTESVSHRFTPYTVPVYGNSVRPPYISVFLRKRSFTTVHILPGYSFAIELNELRIHPQTNLNLSKCFYLSHNIVRDGCKIFLITFCCGYKIVVELKKYLFTRFYSPVNPLILHSNIIIRPILLRIFPYTVTKIYECNTGSLNTTKYSRIRR
jgi:hypothetical protein